MGSWIKTAVIVLFLVLIFLVYTKTNNMQVQDFAKIHSATPYLILKPTSVAEIQKILRDFPDKKISIAGGKFSHGGQTMLDNAVYLDLCNFDQIVEFQPDKRKITVQSGITWDKIQRFIDLYDLSVLEMQSYNNFTVGGSISVNCHGRGLDVGTVGDSVVSMEIMLADGTVERTTPLSKLGKAVIGGYGAIGIILTVTLRLIDNYKIERKITITDIKNDTVGKQLTQICKEAYDNNSDLVFYNGNIYPKAEHRLINVFWVRINDTDSVPDSLCGDRLQSHKDYYWGQMILEQLLRRTESLKYIRGYLEPEILQNTKVITWRNNEMSYDANSLQALFKFPTTTILQEYFVSIENIDNFLAKFWTIIKKHKVNLLNVSLRFVKSTTNVILNYAETDRVAVVLYINILNHSLGIEKSRTWTQELIDLALSMDGTYYLPYLPFASVSQFKEAYPSWQEFKILKNNYDPTARFSNQMIQTYIGNKFFSVSR